MKILILKFHALGDVVRTSYILPGLYDKYDSPAIDWITSTAACELLRYNPYIRNLASPETALSILERNHYDLVLSFDDEEVVLRLIDNFRYEKIIGAFIHEDNKKYSQDSSEWFDMGLISTYGRRIADEIKKSNSREHNQIFADMLGIKIGSGIFYNSSLLEKKMQNEFDSAFFNIGINSSAGSRWKNKEMPLEEVIKLIDKLSGIRINQKNIRIHLLGGEAEIKRNDQIKKGVGSCNIKDWSGQNTLLEFAAIIKACDYVITSDTLALHFSIAQKIANLSYYAPTSANEIGTFGTGMKIISLSDDYCSYRPDADNSSITAERVMHFFELHCSTLNLSINRN